MPSRINQPSLAELIAAKRNPAAAEGIQSAQGGLVQGVNLAESINAKRVAAAQAEAEKNQKIADFALKIKQFKAEEADKASGRVNPNETVDSLDRSVKPEVIAALTPKEKKIHTPLNAGTGVDAKGNRFSVLVDPETRQEQRVGLGIDTDKDKGRGSENQAQKKAAAYAARALQANQQLTSLLKQGYDPTGLRASAESVLPNRALRDQTKQFDQIIENFASANLRDESGAVISKDEIKDRLRMTFPRGGDDQKTLLLKERNRQTIVEGLIEAAGREVGEFTAEKSLPANDPTLQPSKETPPPNGQTSVKQNGVTYDWNSTTGRYE